MSGGATTTPCTSSAAERLDGPGEEPLAVLPVERAERHEHERAVGRRATPTGTAWCRAGRRSTARRTPPASATGDVAHQRGRREGQQQVGREPGVDAGGVGGGEPGRRGGSRGSAPAPSRRPCPSWPAGRSARPTWWPTWPTAAPAARPPPPRPGPAGRRPATSGAEGVDRGVDARQHRVGQRHEHVAPQEPQRRRAPQARRPLDHGLEHLGWHRVGDRQERRVGADAARATTSGWPVQATACPRASSSRPTATVGLTCPASGGTTNRKRAIAASAPLAAGAPSVRFGAMRSAVPAAAEPIRRSSSAL